MYIMFVKCIFIKRALPKLGCIFNSLNIKLVYKYYNRTRVFYSYIILYLK